MMLTSDIRSKFTVFLFFQDLEIGTKLRTALSVEGYEAFAFMDHETVLHRIRESSPHVIVFNLEALMGTLSEFVEEVLKINPEILFLPLVNPEQAAHLEPYREYNFIDLLPEGQGLEVRIKWTMDQICSQLYLSYQNEQLVTDQATQKDQIADLQKKVIEDTVQISDLQERLRSVKIPEAFSARDCLRSYVSVGSKEDLIGIFLQRLTRVSQLHVLYLKYLPSVHNLVATQVLNLEIDKLKGIGAKLTLEEIQNLHATLLRDEAPPSVKELMTQGLKVDDFICRALSLYRGLDGLMLFWSTNTASEASVKSATLPVDLIDNEFTIFSQHYFGFDLGKRYDSVDFEDAVTEVYNRAYYFLKLEEEVARARRLQKAASVLKISLDSWEQISRQGPVVRDSIIRTLANLIKKTSRVNDLVCRTAENEISVILPHSARKGAAIRAERLRRMVEGQSFQYSDRSLTISLGVSEYPSFCSSATELDQTAAQALQFIQNRSGNKVCLYRPNNSFKPDFDVPPI